MTCRKVNDMKIIDFGNPHWKESLQQVYTFRYTETPDFVQCADHITNSVNPEHKEGYDNISLIFPQKFSAGVKAKLRCSFDGWGCPEIILVEGLEKCEDGATRYGACFEVVLYKDGVNVWRHEMDADHKCRWHKRLGLEMPVTQGELHDLEVEVIENYIVFSVDGVSVRLYTTDLAKEFYVGATACEGIVRLHELQISD